MDQEFYSREYLRDSDRFVVDEIERMRASFLGDDMIDDYIEHLPFGDVTKSLVREQIVRFCRLMHKRIDYGIVDFIIRSTDSYSEEEYDRLRDNAEKAKQLVVHET